jgi:Flp pilus assembly protein TadD
MRKGAEEQQQDNVRAAADVYRRVLELDPSVQEAEHNLGTALLLSGSTDAGEQHVRKSLEMDPEYVLARCNLASLEMSRGNAASAHALLDPLADRTDFTLEEVIAYLRTRSDLARADGDIPSAETLLQCLLAYDHDNELAKERLTQLTGQPIGKAG